MGVFGLAGAELTEVLGCTWHYIFEQFHLDAAERLACAVSVSACLLPSLLSGSKGRLVGAEQGTRAFIHETDALKS